MNLIYKVNTPIACKAFEIKNCKQIMYELQDGDVIYLSASDKQYKVGDKYDNNEHLIISKVIRYKRPWWKFWVKRKVIGYETRYVR